MVKREEIIIGEEDMSSFYLKEIVEEETNLSENDMEEEINADDTMESEKDNQTPETDSEG